ncbi:MAG: hypothetical protein Q8P30_01920 [Candidatus Uhrbacteria bacterium]|nr:hypothetical protein [Candidatus Uhrbacteria bacterium]
MFVVGLFTGTLDFCAVYLVPPVVLSLPIMFIGLRIKYEAEEQARIEQEKERSFRKAFSQLLYHSSVAMMHCDHMRQDYVDENVSSFNNVPDAYAEWFKAMDKAHPLFMAPSDEQLGDWSRMVTALLDDRIRRTWSDFADRQHVAINAVRSLLQMSAILEASRSSELRETRLAARKVRWMAVERMLELANVIFNRPGPLANHLNELGNPASLRDVVEEDMGNLMLGYKPWRDDLLKFVFANSKTVKQTND